MRVQVESKKPGLKLNIQKTKIMASGPITWQIEGRKVEAVTDFLSLGSKITADGDCSHKIKRCLFLGRKAMTNLDSILKRGDITLPTKICIVKAVVFPGVMYSREESDTPEQLHFHFSALEKEMATHSSILAWRIPGTEEPGGLRSMGLQRVGHD